MQNSEIKKQITDELKSMGINSRQVSVSVRDSRYDTSIHATIKDLSIKQKDIENVIKKYDDVRWDDHCQEILQGCNTFTFTEYDYHIMEKYREDNKILDKCTEIYNAAEIEDAAGNVYNHYLIPGDERFTFSTKANPHGDYFSIRTQEGNHHWSCRGGYDLVSVMASYLLGHYGTLEAYQEWQKIEDANFKEICRLADIEREAEKVRQAEYKTTAQKAIESINKNSVIVAIPEAEQKIYHSLEWANLNKNNTIDEYYQEIQKGDFYRQDAKATHKWIFNNINDLDYLQFHLLTDYKQLSGLGGTYSDDPRLDEYKDFWSIPEDVRKSCKWYNIGVAVYIGESFQFFIDPQGYDYARYIGLGVQE